MADNKSKETGQTNTIAQDSSEIFDTYKKGILKITEELSKFQPQYVQSISKLQEEYLELTKQFIDKVFAAQRNWVGRQRNFYQHNNSKLDIYTICRTVQKTV